MTNQKASEIKILYEDDFLFVFDKPFGLTVNKSETLKEGEICLEDYLEELREEKGLTEEIERNGIVHRLDKETSGVIVVAKDSETLELLQNEFKERHVKKTYTVIVNGEFKDEYVSVDAPLARNPKNKFKYAVVVGGKQAYTEFKKIKVIKIQDEENGGEEKIFTLLEAYPLTGRTHQIRVHLLALGYPIVSDNLYLNERTYLENRKHFKRLMLHASKIEFTHPRTGELFVLEAPLPEEFKI